MFDPRAQLVGGKSSKYNGMDGSDPNGGQNSDHYFRNERHVDHYAITLSDAQFLQTSGQARYLFQQLSVGHLPHCAGRGAVIDEGYRLGQSGLYVAIYGVVTRI